MEADREMRGQQMEQFAGTCCGGADEGVGDEGVKECYWKRRQHPLHDLLSN